MGIRGGIPLCSWDEHFVSLNVHLGEILKGKKKKTTPPQPSSAIQPFTHLSDTAFKQTAWGRIFGKIKLVYDTCMHK